MMIIKKLIWKLKGSKHIDYYGFMCGCCGRWWNIRQSIPTYKSDGEWWDTVGLCRIGEDDPISFQEKKAIEYLYNGLPYKYSKSIDDTIIYGYRHLDYNGLWKLPLQKSWIDDYKKWNKTL